MEPEIKRLDSTVMYENQWMTVREDRVRREDGSEGIYGVVDKADYSLIVPFDGTHLHLVEQFRYPVGGRFWEFPQGSWELVRDADPLDVAAGELAEETGLRAAKMAEIGTLFQAYGYSNQSVHIFLASDLTVGERSLDHEEQGLVSRSFLVDDVRSMITDGTIRDISSVAAAHLFFNTLTSS